MHEIEDDERDGAVAAVVGRWLGAAMRTGDLSTTPLEVECAWVRGRGLGLAIGGDGQVRAITWSVDGRHVRIRIEDGLSRAAHLTLEIDLVEGELSGTWRRDYRRAGTVTLRRIG